MATTALQELVISLGLDASDFQNGVQQVSQAIADGLGGSLEEVQPLIESTLEGFAEGFTEAAQEAGILGTEGAQAVEEVGEAAQEAAQTIRRDLPQATRQATSQMESHLNSVASKFKNFMMQIVTPIAGAFAISGAVNTFISGAMAAKEAAQQFGVASDELQLWQGAITRAGGNVSRFEMSLRKMTMSAKVSGDPLKAMYKLAGDAEKMSREAFTAKAKELGIDTATIGVLAQGRKALDEHLKRAKEIGIYEERHIELAQKLKIGLWELNGSFDGLKNELLLMVLPAMQKILKVLTDVTLFFSENAPFVAAVIGTVGAAVLLKLLPPLSKLPAVIKAIWLAFTKWGPIIAIITAIALVAEDFYTYLTGGESELEEFWAIFGTGPEIIEAVSAAWRDLKEWGTECLVGLLRWVKQLWQTLEKWGVINDIKSAFMGLGHLIHGVLTKNWDEAAKGAKDFCTNLIKAFVHTAAGIGQALYDFIKGAFERLMAWIKETFTLKNILGGMGELGKELAEAEGWDLEGVNGRDVGEQAAGTMSKQKSPEDAAKEFEKTWSRAFGDWGDESEKAAQGWQDSMLDVDATIKAGMEATAKDSGNAFIEQSRLAAAQIETIFSQMFGNVARSAIPAFAGIRAAYAGATNISNSNSAVNIGSMTVNTRATDANGVARGIGGALNRSRLINPRQTGTIQKGH